MDPELKLFGMKISLPENRAAFAGGDRCGESFNETSDGTSDCYRCLDESSGEEAGEQENLLRIHEEQAEGKVCETSTGNEDEDPEESTNTDVDDSPKSPLTDDDVRLGDQAKNQNGDQKNLKKPDKILPCPRCKSMDTKFCYYNNYNMNQPRHFCKSCQRYWTSGGTMRNVPVGAGRRKNKNSASHCHHITISQALHAARLVTPNSGFHNLKFKPNSTVLSFGPDEKTQPPNGCYKIDQDCLVNESSDGGRNGFRQPTVQNMSWPFPAPLPAIFPHGYPLPPPYYVAPFWNLTWLHMPSSSPTASSPSSPLGKRSRSGELLKSSESSIVVPKTLRMDVPEEAAKSSIWSTLGIKYNSISREGLLKALQPKIDDKKPMATTSPLLQANPAALSRSLTFQETA